MKIAQICQRFYYGGGQERHVLNISKQFVARGHKVNIITSDLGKSEQFIKDLKLAGVGVRVIRGIALDEPANQVLFPELLSYLNKKDYDIIHAHGALCHSSQVSLIAAKFKKIPFVFTPHYHPWNVFDNYRVRQVRRYTEKLVTVPIIQNASACIAVSDYEKQLFIDKYQIKPDKIKVIPNGVDIAFINNSVSRHDVRKKYHIPENKKYVLFFGSTTDLRKGIDRAINSFSIIAKKVPDAHLIIVGSNTDTSVAIHRMIERANLTARVTTCGYVSDKEKVALLRMVHVLISPTIYEAFGIVLAEAMYCEVPVVSTKCGGVPYVMKHGEHGYLVGSYQSRHAFAKYVIRLLKDEKLRRHMGRAGHRRVVRKFQWEEISQDIMDLYEHLSKK